jgi:hypothetical protein
MVEGITIEGSMTYIICLKKLHMNNIEFWLLKWRKGKIKRKKKKKKS